MRRIAALLILAVTFSSAPILASAGSEAAVGAVARAHEILWREPVDIRSRDLYYGPGGRDGQPKGPFTFEHEDLGGTSPKFDVRDAAGKKWKVKLGVEARPETVAARLLWAVGYVTNVNYYVSEMNVSEMPPRLHRGQKLVVHNGNVLGARLQRSPDGKKIGDWEWRHNPFYGTREFNGLRVMMAVISNWDLKTDNNAKLTDRQEAGSLLYEVSDLGSSFGRNGESYTSRMSKDNLHSYEKSKFISKATAERVSFNFPTHLPYLYVFNFPFFVSQTRQRWIGHDIPRSDAKWVGGLLTQLSHKQISDAFRAAGYSPAEVEAYTTAVEHRIRQLEQL